MKEKLNQLIEECKKEILSVNIPISEHILYSIKDIKVWGRCKLRMGGLYEICLSKTLFKSDDKSIKTTLIHEMLHTCEGGMTHKGKWKQYANIMNRKYGYEIKRATSMEEKGLTSDPIIAKYSFTCQECSRVINRERMSKFVKNYRCYTCVCGGELKRVL